MEVIALVSIFNYRFTVAEEAFKNANVQVYSLSDYPTLLKIAEQKSLINQEEQEVLLKWRQEPHSWTGLS